MHGISVIYMHVLDEVGDHDIFYDGRSDHHAAGRSQRSSSREGATTSKSAYRAYA